MYVAYHRGLLKDHMTLNDLFSIMSIQVDDVKLIRLRSPTERAYLGARDFI